MMCFPLFSVRFPWVSQNDYNLDFETVTHDFFIANGMLSSSDSAGVYQYNEANTFPMDLPTLEQTITVSSDTTMYYYNQMLETFVWGFGLAAFVWAILFGSFCLGGFCLGASV